MRVDITLQNVDREDLIILSTEALKRGITVQEYIKSQIKREVNNLKKVDETEINRQLLRELFYFQ